MIYYSSHHDPKQNFFQGIAFLVVFGVGLIWHAFKTLKLERKIKDMPTSPIGSAPQGSVELQGYAWPVEVLKSPLTAKSCVFYHFKIEELRNSGKNSHWEKIFEDKSVRPFGIIDKTGYAVVFPEGGEANILCQTLNQSGLTPELQMKVQNYLASRGSSLDIHPGFFSNKKRFIEYVIPVGSPFYVLGSFKTVSGLRPYNLVSGCDTFISKLAGSGAHTALTQVDTSFSHDRHAYYENLARASNQVFANVSGDDFGSAKSITSNSNVSGGPFESSKGILVHAPESPLFFADAHQDELLSRLGSWGWAKITLGAGMIALAAGLVFQHVFGK